MSSAWRLTPHPAVTARREVLLAMGLLAASGVAWARTPRIQQRLLGKSKLDNLVPKLIGEWRFETQSGLILPPTDQLSDSIYDDLLTRTYTRADGQSIMLLIAYSGAQDGALQVHRPEVCYPASGYHIVETAPHEIPLASNLSVPGRYIVADGDSRAEQLIYWTRLGTHFPTRWSEQRLAVIEENFAGLIPDGVLARISTLMPGNSTEVLEAFAGSLFASVSPTMKRVLTGRA